MVRGPMQSFESGDPQLSERENGIYSADVKEASLKVDEEHTDGPVPECLSQQACQFKVLTFDDVIVNSKERDFCIKIYNKLVWIIVEDKGAMSINRWNTSLNIQLTLKNWVFMWFLVSQPVSRVSWLGGSCRSM